MSGTEFGCMLAAISEQLSDMFGKKQNSCLLQHLFCESSILKWWEAQAGCFFPKQGSALARRVGVLTSCVVGFPVAPTNIIANMIPNMLAQMIPNMIPKSCLVKLPTACVSGFLVAATCLDLPRLA